MIVVVVMVLITVIIMVMVVEVVMVLITVTVIIFTVYNVKLNLENLNNCYYPKDEEMLNSMLREKNTCRQNAI